MSIKNSGTSEESEEPTGLLRDVDDCGDGGPTQDFESSCRKDLLKIFVSSAMGDEESHAWLKFRAELAESLRSSSVFEPFAIEEHGSVLRSKSYYLTKIEEADIVVSVVYSTLRPGTENEIRYAVKLKKPLLFVQVGECGDDGIGKIRSYLHSYDYCTTYQKASFDGLPDLIVRWLTDDLITIFRGRVREIQTGDVSGVGVHDGGAAALPTEVLEAFGESTASLSARYGCESGEMDFASLGHEVPNPYLSPLGTAIIACLVDGRPFDLGMFNQTMELAMKDSGCSDEVLRHRHCALSAAVRGDFGTASSEIDQACAAMSDRDSWVYGNLLIDRRNIGFALNNDIGLAHGAQNSGMEIALAATSEIEQMKRPIMFPLAAKFKFDAYADLRKSQESAKTRRPGSVVYDNRIDRSLRNVATAAFVSVMYGSIASLLQTRVALAEILLGYAEAYRQPRYAYEGLRLLLLAGESDTFCKYKRALSDTVYNEMASKADEMWDAAKKCPEKARSRVMCVFAEECAGYLSDEAFDEVVGFLTADIGRFGKCRERWWKALDAIKLRIAPAKLFPAMAEAIAGGMYLSAHSLGRIILDSDLTSVAFEEATPFIDALRDYQSNLLQEGMPLVALGVVEETFGVAVLDGELLRASIETGSIEAVEYQVVKKEMDDGALAKIYLKTLRNQVRTNDNPGCHVAFGSNVAPPLVELIRKNGDCIFDDECCAIIGEIARSAISYKGALSTIDGALSVVFELGCVCGSSADPSWAQAIGQLKDARPGIPCYDDPLDFCPEDVWRCRVGALRVAFELEGSENFLAMGVMFQELSYAAELVYAESFARLVERGCVGDEHKELSCAMARLICSNPERKVRCLSVKCLSSCARRWGADIFREELYGLANDPSEEVRFCLLKVCKHQGLGDGRLEHELRVLLATDANWFVRWHAERSGEGDL